MCFTPDAEAPSEFSGRSEPVRAGSDRRPAHTIVFLATVVSFVLLSAECVVRIPLVETSSHMCPRA